MPEEQIAILDKLAGQNRNLFQIVFWTGLHTPELVALEWGDVGWPRGMVRISRAHTQAVDEAEIAKTRLGFRDVKLLLLPHEALQKQKQLSAAIF